MPDTDVALRTVLTGSSRTAGEERATFVGAIVTLLHEHAGTWSGTAAELHALLPGHAADAPRLAKALTQAVDDLAAAGITIERRRQPGTGARILVLTREAEQPAAAGGVTVGLASIASSPATSRDAVTVNAPIVAVTVTTAVGTAMLDAQHDTVTLSPAQAAVTLPADTDAPEHADRPLLPCTICGGRDWRWHPSIRRRASRWCCSSCDPQP